MDVILILAALLGLCAGLNRYAGLPAGASPLAALSLAYLTVLAGGLCGALQPAKWLVLAIGWLLLVLLALRGPKVGRLAFWRGMLTPGSALFWGGAALLALRLAWLQPQLLNFDEYSFWGPAVKWMTLENTLYPALDTGRPWVMTELPALPILGYLCHLGAYAPWRQILSADLAMLAALAAVVACGEKAGKRVWGPLVLAALFCPMALSVSGSGGVLSTVWLETMGDVPAGVLFGGVVAFWLAVRSVPAARWLVWPVLCLAAGIKSNTLPLALAAAGLIFLDHVLLPPADAARGGRALAARAGFGLVGLVLPLVQYLGWTAYIGPFVAANAQTGGMGDTAAVSLPQVVVNGVKMLLGGAGTEYFEARRADLYAYADAMAQSFTGRQVSWFGTGVATVAVIGMVFLLALLAAPGGRQRMRVALMALGSGACFGGYWLMLLLSYAFIFKDSAPSMLGLASYVRYMDSYYLGWLLLAVALLAAQAGRNWRGRFAVLLPALLLAAVTFTTCQPQFTVFGVSPRVYDERNADAALAAAVSGRLEPEDRVFLIHQGDDGFYWFYYAQALAPNVLEYGAGGGTYGDPAKADGGSYYQPYTAAQLDTLMRKNDTNCVLIVKNDSVFTDSYADLFSDELAAAQTGVALYRIAPDGYTPAWVLNEAGDLIWQKEGAV